MDGSRTLIAHRTGIVVAAILFLFSLATSSWVHGHHLDAYLSFRSDSLGYYQFLPKLFLDHDIEYMHWFHYQEDGKRLSIFTIGVAWLQLPFFLLGHAWAVLTDAPRTGFSTPYAASQLIGASTYLAVAGYLLHRVVNARSNAQLATRAILLLYLGTNLFFYSSFDVGMSHVYSFFLFAVLLYSVEWPPQRADEVRPALLIPLAALIVLVRPLNIVVLLLPFIHRTKRVADLRDRIITFTRRPLVLFLGLSLAFLLTLPQWLYWHAVKGRWFLYTYGTKGESFDLSAPHLFDVLINHQNGWFIYTPLMALVMGMLLWQARERGNGARSILLVWSITWFLYGCWWAWWLGGAFGYRGFIEYTALLIVPLASLLGAIGRLPRPKRIAINALLGLFVFLNLRLSLLYSAPWDGPDWTWGRFFHEVGRAFYLA